ncbi:MAG: DUF533 domain-containing protein [Pseudomonadota bacterium]
MVNVERLLEDLRNRAEAIADEVDVDAQVEDAKAMARRVKERLETDETARTYAMGGGVLLAALLATRGGRRLTGNVAKTGLVAGLGALAYRAWQQRQGEAAPSAGAPGFVAGDAAEPDFSAAIVHAMATAAHADGVIDPEEMEALDGAARDAGGELSSLVDGSLDEAASLDLIARAAKTPNHAAQLYAAAALATGSQAPEESAFLNRLAERLGVSPQHASAIHSEAAR